MDRKGPRKDYSDPPTQSVTGNITHAHKGDWLWLHRLNWHCDVVALIAAVVLAGELTPPHLYIDFAWRPVFEDAQVGLSVSAPLQLQKWHDISPKIVRLLGPFWMKKIRLPLSAFSWYLRLSPSISICMLPNICELKECSGTCFAKQTFRLFKEKWQNYPQIFYICLEHLWHHARGIEDRSVSHLALYRTNICHESFFVWASDVETTSGL